MSTLVLLVQSQENPDPPIVASGSGAASVGLSGIANATSTTSTGSSTVGMSGFGARALPTGDGSATATGERLIIPEMRLTILEPTSLPQAPGVLTCVLTEGFAETEVVFAIDGVTVRTATADSEGALTSISIMVPETTTAGTHTLTATQVGSAPASATFTVENEPAPVVVEEPPLDPDPVDVPEAVISPEVRRWVLQDPRAGGLGNYILTINPSSMTSPHGQRTLQGRHTTARSGQFHVWEAGPAPVQWQFSGYCPTQEMHDKLVAFGDLNRRFYVLDHRGRAWLVTFIGVDLRPRLRQSTSWGIATDWGHDYTVTALIYDRRPIPAPEVTP